MIQNLLKDNRILKKIINKNSIDFSNLLNDIGVTDNNIFFNIDPSVLNENKYSLVLKNKSENNILEKEISSDYIEFPIKKIFDTFNNENIGIFLKDGKKYHRIRLNSKIEHIFAQLNGRFIYTKKSKSNNLLLNIKKVPNKYHINELSCENDSIIVKGEFNLNNKFNEFILNNLIPYFFIEFKHRSSGRFLEKPISEAIQFNIDELLNIGDDGYFDVYLKYKHDSFINKKRLSYNSKHQFFKAVSLNKQKVIRSFRTKFNNLSLIVYSEDFDCNLKKLEVKGDELYINGEFELINPDLMNITDSKIILKPRNDFNYDEFDLNINCEGGSVYKFNAKMTIPIEEDDVFTAKRYDLFIRLYDGDLYYQSSIDVTMYADLYKGEDKYLTRFEKENNVYAYYATLSNSLAFLISPKDSFEKSYKLTKGRTIYEESLNKKVDNNLVFFESFFGKAYSGNPKYIYEKMLEMGLDKKYKFVWAYSGENKDIIPGNPIIVERYEPGDYYKYLGQAKYWINNIIFPVHKKRSKTVYLQTWHGTPLKKLGFDITIEGPEVEARSNFHKESRNWDYLISSNNYSSVIFKRAFKFNKQILEVGYPANDILFKDNYKFVNDLKSKLNIPSHKKIILYAPTWKDDEQVASWKHYFNLEIDLNRLYEEFNDDYVIILKMHHLVSEKLDLDDKFKNFVFDLSSYDDIQELYLLADLLITDYSSVFFDYAHLKRPIFFFVPDLEHYHNDVRGLYLDMKNELPGPLIFDNDELIDNIKNIDEVSQDYAERYNEFYQKFCSLCNGESAQKVIEEVFEL